MSAIPVAAFPAGAQIPARLSIDATVGAGIGHGGERDGLHAGIAVDGIATWRARYLARGSFLIGFSAGVQGSLGHGDSCEAAGGGGCMAGFPIVQAVGFVAGLEHGFPWRTSVRVLGGLARYGIVDEDASGIGLQGRIDLSTAEWRGLAFVTSLRAAIVPQLRKDLYEFGAIGVGLRL